MKHRIIVCILAAAMLLMAVSMSGCGSAAPDDGALSAAAAELIQKSVAINEIYFGAGLEPVAADSPEAKALLSELHADAAYINFLPVAGRTGYTSIASIKEATEEVYSQSYCEYLYQLAFKGISADDVAATYARYMETDNGILTVRRDIEGIPLRTYGTEIEVLENSGSAAVVRVQSYLDGKEDVAVEVQMIFENGAWRLDSPTY